MTSRRLVRWTGVVLYAPAIVIALVGCEQRKPTAPTGVAIRDLGTVALAGRPSWIAATSEIAVGRPSSGSLIIEAIDVTSSAGRTLGTIPNASSLYDFDDERSVFLLGRRIASSQVAIIETKPDGTVIGTYSVPTGTVDELGTVSPDGTHIAFVRRSESTQATELCVRPTGSFAGVVSSIYFAGTDKTTLAISWIGNERILANFSDDTSDTWSVVVPEAGGAPTYLRSNDSWLAASSNGRFYAGVEGPALGGTTLFVQRADASGWTSVLAGQTPLAVVTWSPTNTDLAFFALGAGGTHLMVAMLPPLQ